MNHFTRLLSRALNPSAFHEASLTKPGCASSTLHRSSASTAVPAILPPLDSAILLRSRDLTGRELSQPEINAERIARWRRKYAAAVSISNWLHYQRQSKETH